MDLGVLVSVHEATAILNLYHVKRTRQTVSLVRCRGALFSSTERGRLRAGLCEVDIVMNARCL